MSSFTKSGNLKQRANPYSDDLTLKQIDQKVMRWLRRKEAGRCPRCNKKIQPNSGLHCPKCYKLWLEEFGSPL